MQVRMLEAVISKDLEFAHEDGTTWTVRAGDKVEVDLVDMIAITENEVCIEVFPGDYTIIN